MKKLISAVLSIVICFSLFQSIGFFVFGQEPEETYSVIFYEDSTKSNILFKRENQAPGTPLVLTFEPTKEGHTFISWIDAETGEAIEVINDVFIVPEKDLECYGTWSVNSYKLYYRGFGVTPFKEYDVIYGTPKSEMPVPEEEPQKAGYEFIAWSELPEIMPAGIVDIVAQWNAIDFQANFYINPDDENAFYSESYSYGDEIVAPEEKPSKTGYTFVGWSRDGETVTDDLGTVGESDASIYAVWKANKYLAAFNAGDGEFADGTKEKTVSVEYDSQIVFNEEPVRENYIFNGWEPELPVTMPASNYTVTATWKRVEVSHNLKEVIEEPTCTEDGKRYSVCSDCGETIGEVTVIPAKGHRSSDWIIVVEPTVKTEGKRIKKCTVCGFTLSEEVIEKLENTDKDNYSNAEINIRNNPVNATLNYGETLKVYAVTENFAKNERVEWSVSGKCVEIINADGVSCEVKSVSGGTAKLTATVVDAEGNPVMSASGEKISDSQFINSKAGFIQKIIAFFRNLFGINKVITQTVKNFI
ncbi:MAG: InlB B-repeat-containing protein [Clostridia bacterium]|nr:InlB B-repeat-containing protein [Clostridia bacterium]